MLGGTEGANASLQLHASLRRPSLQPRDPALFPPVPPFFSQVSELKAHFNQDFEVLAKLKRSEADRIMDINTKIDETVGFVVPACLPSCIPSQLASSK